MKGKTAKSLIAAAMLTSLLSVSGMSVEAWTQGEQINTDTNVPYDSDFSGYEGPNQGNLINWGGGTKVTVTGSVNDTAVFNDNTGVSDAGGAVYNGWGGTTEVQSGSSFVNNTSNRGGAVWNNGKLTFLGKALFRGNRATTSTASNDMAGGAIVNSHFGDDADSGVLSFGKGVEFKENTAVQGGAIKQGGSITVKGGALFENNSATDGNGGAVFNAAGWGEDTVERKDSYDTLTAKNNTATECGGAYFIDDDKGALEVSGKAVFQKNTAGVAGGAIYNEGSVKVGKNSSFSENSAMAGGAVYNSGTVTIGSGSSFSGNISSSEYGGAIYNEGELVLNTEKNKNITFSKNKANGKANDIYLASNSSMKISGGGKVVLNSGLTSGEAVVSAYSLGASAPDIEISGENTELVLGGSSDVDANIKFTGNSKLTNNASTTLRGNIGVDGTGDASITNSASGQLTFADTSVSNGVDLNNQGKAVIGGSFSNADVVNNNDLTVSGSVATVNISNNENKTLKMTDTSSADNVVLTNKGNATIAGSFDNSSVTNDKNLTISGNADNVTIENNASGTVKITKSGSASYTGVTSSVLKNNGTAEISGTYNGTITQKDKDASLKIDDGATLSADGQTIEGGSLIFAGNGALASGTKLNVLDSVNLQLASTTIDSEGLSVGGGHIISSTGMNLIGADYGVGGDILKTSVIITNGSINANTSDTLKIASGNTLTLSDDNDGVISEDKFLVESGATIKLAPTKTGTLTLTDANDITGDGDILVDQIIKTESVLQDDGTYKDETTKLGVGTIKISSDNKGFSGTFTQKMGSVIQQAGRFFGGNSTIEGGSVTIKNGAEVDSASLNLKAGTVNLENGSKFKTSGVSKISGGVLNIRNGAKVNSSTIDVTKGETSGYGTLNIYNPVLTTTESADMPLDEDGNEISFNAVIKADEIGNNTAGGAVLKYLNEAPADPLDPETADYQTIKLTDGAGLGLFNGTLIDGDLTLYSDNGVRDLTLGSGSGINGENINLGQDTKLTYLDDAYIRDYSNVTMDQGSKLTFNYSDENTNVDYTSVISSIDTSDSEYTSLIHKTGAGKLNILSTLKDYHGSVKVDGGGVLNLENEDAIVLNNIDVNNSELYSASQKVNATGNVTIENNAVAEAEGDLIVSGDTKILNSQAHLAGDLTSKNITLTNSKTLVDGNTTANGKLTVTGGSLDAMNDVIADVSVMNNSVVNVNGDLSSSVSADIANTKLNVLGSAVLGDTTVSGDNTVINLKQGAVLNSLSFIDGGLINTPADIAVNNTLTLGSATGLNPTINLTSGAINTITAKDVILNGSANIAIDADPRSKAIDSIIASNSVSRADSSSKLLVSGINLTATPIDRNIDLDISKLLTGPGSTSDMVGIADGGVIATTEMGKYLLTSSSSSNIVKVSLLELNPQMYRGQVATSASYANQLVVNNMLLEHTNILANDLIARDRNANRFAAANPVFAPYQYSKKDGDLWYKAYGNFERITMTQGLHVGNNAYGSLIGADFPLIELGNGWNIVPTGYVAYNGGHQHFSGVSMYQDGAQVGAMASAYKGDFITSLLAYGGGYHNHMSVHGPVGYGSDDTGNWFAGVASKTAYNIHLPADFIFQPTGLVSYNIFGNQNYHSDFGNMSMNSGFLNGINVAPGMNLIWNKKTFSLYGTAQLVFNIMGDVSGKAGNVNLDDVRMKTTYFEYGLGAMKRFKDTFNAYLQFTIRNGYRTGIGFQGGLQWKVGKDKMGYKSKTK